jgi:hypothetical protein
MHLRYFSATYEHDFNGSTKIYELVLLFDS